MDDEQRLHETPHLLERARVGVVEVVEGLVEPEVWGRRGSQHAVMARWGRHKPPSRTTAKKPRRPRARHAHRAREHEQQAEGPHLPQPVCSKNTEKVSYTV